MPKNELLKTGMGIFGKKTEPHTNSPEISNPTQIPYFSYNGTGLMRRDDYMRAKEDGFEKGKEFRDWLGNLAGSEQRGIFSFLEETGPFLEAIGAKFNTKNPKEAAAEKMLLPMFALCQFESGVLNASLSKNHSTGLYQEINAQFFSDAEFGIVTTNTKTAVNALEKEREGKKSVSVKTETETVITQDGKVLAKIKDKLAVYPKPLVPTAKLLASSDVAAVNSLNGKMENWDYFPDFPPAGDGSYKKCSNKKTIALRDNLTVSDYGGDNQSIHREKGAAKGTILEVIEPGLTQENAEEAVGFGMVTLCNGASNVVKEALTEGDMDPKQYKTAGLKGELKSVVKTGDTLSTEYRKLDTGNSDLTAFEFKQMKQDGKNPEKEQVEAAHAIVYFRKNGLS